MATFAGLWGAQQFVSATTGDPLHSTPFTVYTDAALTTPATLYTSRTKAVTAANPATTDVYGNGYFFADPGIYYVKCQNIAVMVEVYEDPSEAPDSSLYSAKGSFLVATAPGTPADFPIGTNGMVPVADSTAASGIRWETRGVVAYVQSTTAQTGVSAEADLTDLTVTWTAVAGRLHKYTLQIPQMIQNTGAGIAFLKITDTSNNVKGQGNFGFLGATQFEGLLVVIEAGISAGSVTRKARGGTTANTVDFTASGGPPYKMLMVEDVGAA